MILPGWTTEPPVLQLRKADELLHRLRVVDRSTIVAPIAGQDDVTFMPDGRTRAGNRHFTTTALLQLCHLVSPGLGQLVQDMGQDEDVRIRRLAIDMVNRLVVARFDRIHGRQTVRNVTENTVDGIVGGRYRYLSNLDFYRQVEAVPHMVPLSFFTSVLCGRYLVLRYVQADHGFTTKDESADKYWLGLHYCNSEIGDSSVQAAPLLVRRSTGDSCLGPSIGRVTHSGRDFERRLRELTHSVVDRHDTPEAYRKRAFRLSRMLLGLADGTTQQKQVRRQQIVSRLHRRGGIPLSLARAILHSCLLKGAVSDDADETLLDTQTAVLGRRSSYDICVALMREARTLHIDAREAVERVAWDLLAGTFSVVDVLQPRGAV